MLAAGSAGVEAATNIVVKKAWLQMLLLVYAAVAVLCLITFRSWRAAVVAMVPLVITSILCEALMVGLGIGVKVATLPVVALGVGIGVDYALYLLSVQMAQMRAGMSLAEAYGRTLRFTGKVVVLVGVTLAAGVITWALSPIKFQADMGILLAFMFLWNMVGAVVLIPALSYVLLRPGSAPACRSPLHIRRGDVHRQGRGPGGHHPGRGRDHLGVLAHQVPGRHGHPARLHVHLEHGRRSDPHSGAVALPLVGPDAVGRCRRAAARGQRRARLSGPAQRRMTGDSPLTPAPNAHQFGDVSGTRGDAPKV